MNRIAELRNEMGMSQNDLAKKLKVHQTAVSQWESERTSPRYDALEAMSKMFDVSIRYLLGQSVERTGGANMARSPSWRYDLEKRLNRIGFSIGQYEEDAMEWINYPDGTLEITGYELEELYDNAETFLRFQLQQLKDRRKDDFKPNQKP